MSSLGVNLIDFCVKKTKDFLFPINKKLWLKLGLVTLLAGMGSSSTNFNFNAGKGIPADFLQIISNNLHWILFGFAGIIILGVIFALIRSLFNFVLLDSVEKMQCLIKKSLSENSDLAISYFLLTFVVNGIFLLAIFALMTPLFIRVFQNINNPQLTAYPYFWISLPIFILLFICLSIINGIIYNLVMPEMYLQRIKSLESFKRMFRLFFKQIKEVIIYWIMRFLLSIAAGIIGMVVFFILLIGLGLVGGLIFGLGYLISLASSILIVPLIVIGILIGICLFFLFIYAVAVVLVPIPVFFANYRLSFYKSLIKK